MRESKIFGAFFNLIDIQANYLPFLMLNNILKCSIWEFLPFQIFWRQFYIERLKTKKMIFQKYSTWLIASFLSDTFSKNWNRPQPPVMSKNNNTQVPKQKLKAITKLFMLRLWKKPHPSFAFCTVISNYYFQNNSSQRCTVFISWPLFVVCISY